MRIPDETIRERIMHRCIAGDAHFSRPEHEAAAVFPLSNGNVFVFVDAPSLPLHATMTLTVPGPEGAPIQTRGEIVGRSRSPRAPGYVVRPERPIEIPRPRSDRLRFLVVNPDRDFADMLCLWLEDAGFEVLHVRKGKHAMRALKKAGVTFDGVVVDSLLPDTTGNSLIRRIRKLAPDMRILAISGATRKRSARDRVLDAGANVFLPKPVTEISLREALLA